MTNLRQHHFVRATVVAAIMTLAVSAPARAQFGGVATIDLSHGVGAARTVCEHHEAAWVPSATLSADCHPVGLDAIASARAVSGTLGVETFLDATNPLAGTTDYSHAFAEALWRDHLSWAASDEELTLIFVESVRGSWFSRLNASPTFIDQYAGTSGAFSLFTSLPRDPHSPNGGFGWTQSIGPAGARPDLTTFEKTIDSFSTFMFTIGVGVTGADIQMALTNDAIVGMPDPNGAGSAGTEFMHTAQLTSVQFLDASGNDVTDQMNYQFEHGLQIGAVTVTPEPATVFLMGAGLAGLVLVCRRRA